MYALNTTSEALPPWHTFTCPSMKTGTGWWREAYDVLETAGMLMWMSSKLEAMCTAFDVLSFRGTFLASILW